MEAYCPSMNELYVKKHNKIHQLRNERLKQTRMIAKELATITREQYKQKKTNVLTTNAFKIDRKLIQEAQAELKSRILHLEGVKSDFGSAHRNVESVEQQLSNLDDIRQQNEIKAIERFQDAVLKAKCVREEAGRCRKELLSHRAEVKLLERERAALVAKLPRRSPSPLGRLCLEDLPHAPILQTDNSVKLVRSKSLLPTAKSHIAVNVCPGDSEPRAPRQCPVLQAEQTIRAELEQNLNTYRQGTADRIKADIRGSIAHHKVSVRQHYDKLVSQLEFVQRSTARKVDAPQPAVLVKSRELEHIFDRAVVNHQPIEMPTQEKVDVPCVPEIMALETEAQQAMLSLCSLSEATPAARLPNSSRAELNSAVTEPAIEIETTEQDVISVTSTLFDEESKRLEEELASISLEDVREKLVSSVGNSVSVRFDEPARVDQTAARKDEETTLSSELVSQLSSSASEVRRVVEGAAESSKEEEEDDELVSPDQLLLIRAQQTRTLAKLHERLVNFSKSKRPNMPSTQSHLELDDDEELTSSDSSLLDTVVQKPVPNKPLSRQDSEIESIFHEPHESTWSDEENYRDPPRSPSPDFSRNKLESSRDSRLTEIDTNSLVNSLKQTLDMARDAVEHTPPTLASSEIISMAKEELAYSPCLPSLATASSNCGDTAATTSARVGLLKDGGQDVRGMLLRTFLREQLLSQQDQL